MPLAIIPKPAPRANVLVVDDDADVLDALLCELRSLGYAAEGTTDAQAAIRLAADGRYEVALVDLLMSVNGIELMREIAGKSPAMAFILMTGAGDVRDQDSTSIGGRLTSVLLKPFKAAELDRALKQAFEVAGNGLNRTTNPEALVRILLVEDSPSDAFLLSALLRSYGAYDVTHVIKLADAVKLVHKEEFDTIITDLTLPDALGLGAVIRLRECAPEATLLVCSSLADEQVALRVIELGAQDFIVKGSAPETLGRALRFARVRRRAEQRFVHLAHSDALTGLSNRRGFADALERAVEQAKRHGSGVALMYIDLDGFKAVNDTRGHDAGDQLLKEIAGRIRGCLRSFDIAARLGGDEFAVLAPDLSDSGLRALAQHIGSAISEPVELEAGALRLTASIGLAQFPTNAEGAAGLLKVADDAMYRAKRAGKDRFKPSGEFDAKCDRH